MDSVTIKYDLENAPPQSMRGPPSPGDHGGEKAIPTPKSKPAANGHGMAYTYTLPQPMPAPVYVAPPVHIAPSASAAAPAPNPAAAGTQPHQHQTAKKPHPLLWVALGNSVLALVLGVPKGSLPTLTGRHKVLRAQERLVQERLSLLSHFSAFLPPPLAALLAPDLEGQALDLVRLGSGLQLWSVGGSANSESDEFWTLEELGAGSVIRSHGGKREVWILAEDEKSGAAALAASLAARERVLRDLEACRSTCSRPSIGEHDQDERERELAAREAAVAAHERSIEVQSMRASDRAEWEKEVRAREVAKAAAEAEERALRRRRELDAHDAQRAEEQVRRAAERAEEVAAREREVVRREKWVVDAMRKISERNRENADELTMEDRITERLKTYKRQLAELQVD